MNFWVAKKSRTFIFRKDFDLVTHHPGPSMAAKPVSKRPPMLRYLLLDGGAIDMDEFELDLLSLYWIHVNNLIFLEGGMDRHPYHYRHAT